MAKTAIRRITIMYLPDPLRHSEGKFRQGCQDSQTHLLTLDKRILAFIIQDSVVFHIIFGDGNPLSIRAASTEAISTMPYSNVSLFLGSDPPLGIIPKAD